MDSFFGVFAFYYDRTVARHEAVSGGERGVWDGERSTNWDSNSGRLECNSAVCRQSAHEAISTDVLLNRIK